MLQARSALAKLDVSDGTHDVIEKPKRGKKDRKKGKKDRKRGKAGKKDRKKGKKDRKRKKGKKDRKKGLKDAGGGGGDYFLTETGQSCSDACAARGEEMDVAAVADAASSADQCQS